jgi:cytochrome P450
MNSAPELLPNSYPVSDIDPYSNEVLIDPWRTYAELQRLGSAVWLTKHQMFAVTRYDSVVQALKDTSAFSSASGVMMNDDMNQVLRGNTLCSDGADHRRLRRIIAKPLTPTTLNSLKVEITAKAPACRSTLLRMQWDYPKRGANECSSGLSKCSIVSDH